MNALARRKAARHRRIADRWDRRPGWMTALWALLLAANVLRAVGRCREAIAKKAETARPAPRRSLDLAQAHGSMDPELRSKAKLMTPAEVSRTLAELEASLTPSGRPQDHGPRAVPEAN